MSAQIETLDEQIAVVLIGTATAAAIVTSRFGPVIMVFAGSAAVGALSAYMAVRVVRGVVDYSRQSSVTPAPGYTVYVPRRRREFGVELVTERHSE